MMCFMRENGRKSGKTSDVKVKRVERKDDEEAGIL